MTDGGAQLRQVGGEGGSPASARLLAATELMVEATRVLNESLDVKVTLERIAELSTEHLADWCSVDLVGADGSLRRLLVTASNSADQPLVEHFEARHPVDLELPFGPTFVFSMGESQLIAEVPDDLLVAASEDEEDLALLRSLGLRSAMIVPISARGRVLGVITLATSHSDRVYDAEDLALAEEIGRRAGLALDNARLFDEVSRAEAWLRALVHDVEGIVWEADTDDLGYTFVSEHVSHLLGYAPGHWADPNFRSSVIDPQDRSRVADVLREAAREGRDADYEYRARTSGGRLVWLRDIVHVTVDDSGRRLRGLTTDITGRKQDELRKDAVEGMANALAHAADLDSVADDVLGAIGGPLGFDVGELWMLDDDRRELSCRGVWLSDDFTGRAFVYMARDMVFREGEGLPGAVWASHAPKWVRRVGQEENFPRAAEAAADGLASAIGFPILAGADVLGVLCFFGRDVREPDDDLLRTVQALGQQIGQFVERVRVESSLRFYLTLLAAQSDASPEAVLVVNPEGRPLYYNRRLLEIAGVSEDAIENATIADVALLAQEWIVAPRELMSKAIALHNDPHRSLRHEIRTKDDRVFDAWSSPLRGRDGTAYGRAWYLRDISERKRTEAMLRQSKERFEFLAGASSLLATAHDFDAILASSASLVTQFLSDACVAVELLRDKSTRLAASVPGPDVDGIALRHVFVDHDATALLASDQPRIVDLTTDESGNASRLRRLGFASMMVLPLHERGGRVLGALGALRHGPFTLSDLHLADIFARRAALAAENAQLYQDRQIVAETLQQGLLPPELPRIPGAALARRYIPGRTGTQVGGDFYDVFETGDGGWGLVIGDVCGKGAEAAGLTALARYTIRAVAMRTRRPSRILGPLNEAILRQRTDRRFCTVAYARVVRAGQNLRLSVCLGGHPPPIIVRVDGRIERLGERGTLLGVFADPELTDRHAELRPGDALVMYTDGVTEARGPDGIFGLDRLEAVLRHAAAYPAEAIASAVESAVKRHQHGDDPRDDLALVVLRAATEAAAG